MSYHHSRWLILAAALQLVRALETYGEFFDHPGWAEPTTQHAH